MLCERICICILVGIFMGPAFSAELHVPAQYADLQDAISDASDGDVVIVAPGTYTGSFNFLGKAITVQSTAPDDDAVRDATILRNMEGTCVRFQSGEKASSVLTGLRIIVGGISCTASSPSIVGNRLDRGGIVCSQSSASIVNNLFTPVSSTQYTITCSGSAVTIEGNTIYGNKLAGYEQLGAIGIDGGIPGAPTVISRNTIIGIQGKYGIYVQDWSYGLSVIITGNEILKSGADAFWAIQTLRTEHCLIAGNIVADNRGYGVFDSSWRSSTFFGNIVMGNSGRGLVLDGSMEQPILVQDNRVSDNSGTGIFCIYAKYPIIISNDIFGNMNFGMEVNEALHGGILSCNIIAGNGSGGWGGGALIVNSYISFLGNTVVGNEAAVGGGGLEVSGVAVAVANNIFWDNRAPVGRSIWVRASRPHPQTHVSYSSVASGSDELLLEGSAILGPGNIDVDPLFVDPGHWDDAGTPDDTSDDVFIPGDYHLLPGSPCIDAGTNDVDNPDTPETETLPDTDIAGIPRVIDGDLDGVATVDIGAYEYLPGDLNHDGKVNVLDLLLVRNSLGRDPASSIEARKADVNADGAVNVEDLIMVRGRLAR